LATAQECARELLDVIPIVMWHVRAGVRANTRVSLSMPQFGTVVYLRHHERASLSDLATHMGLTPPSASKLVDGLVARGMVSREPHPADRRRLMLTLTAEGRGVMRAAREAAISELIATLATSTASDRDTVIGAMRALRIAFARERTAGAMRVTEVVR
jgi:MarR family transcriptional regulator for hemolysin